MSWLEPAPINRDNKDGAFIVLGDGDGGTVLLVFVSVMIVVMMMEVLGFVAGSNLRLPNVLNPKTSSALRYFDISIAPRNVSGQCTAFVGQATGFKTPSPPDKWPNNGAGRNLHRVYCRRSLSTAKSYFEIQDMLHSQGQAEKTRGHQARC